MPQEDNDPSIDTAGIHEAGINLCPNGKEHDTLLLRFFEVSLCHHRIDSATVNKHERLVMQLLHLTTLLLFTVISMAEIFSKLIRS